MSLAKFEKAAEIIQNMPTEGPVNPTQDDKLYFYSNFKQATLGDCNTTRPGLLDFTGKAKWDAWNGLKGKDKAEAREDYVQRLVNLLEKAGTEDAKKWLGEIAAA